MWLDGSLNQTLWLPEIGVLGTGGNCSTISLRLLVMSFSDEILAATPLFILTVPGTVLNTASFNKAAHCWLTFATSAEAVAALGGVSPWSSASLFVSKLMVCACAPSWQCFSLATLSRWSLHFLKAANLEDFCFSLARAFFYFILWHPFSFLFVLWQVA